MRVNAVYDEIISPPPAWEPVEALYSGLIIDASSGKVLKRLDDREMRTKYGVNLTKLDW